MNSRLHSLSNRCSIGSGLASGRSILTAEHIMPCSGPRRVLVLETVWLNPVEHSIHMLPLAPSQVIYIVHKVLRAVERWLLNQVLLQVGSLRHWWSTDYVHRSLNLERMRGIFELLQIWVVLHQAVDIYCPWSCRANSIAHQSLSDILKALSWVTHPNIHGFGKPSGVLIELSRGAWARNSAVVDRRILQLNVIVHMVPSSLDGSFLALIFLNFDILLLFTVLHEKIWGRAYLKCDWILDVA